MSEISNSQRPKNWAEVDVRVRKSMVEMLRGHVLSAEDQAERFRNPESKHRDEATALQWDEHARIYRDALELLKAGIRKGQR